MAWFDYNTISGKSKHVAVYNNGALADGAGVVFGNEVDALGLFTEKDEGAIILSATIVNNSTTNSLYFSTSEEAVKVNSGRRGEVSKSSGQFVPGPLSCLTIWAAPGDASTTAYSVTVEWGARAPDQARDEPFTADLDWITADCTSLTADCTLVF